MKTLTIFILTFLASCQNLHDNSNDLIGQWECYHKELEDGTTKSTDLFSGEEFEYYNDLTGFGETEPNAIMYHSLEQIGTDCENCGKPYRTPKAKLCASCGNKRIIAE